MPSLTRFLSETPDVDDAAAERLQLLVGDWNLVADLLRADLVLWVRSALDVVAVAHCRPSTGRSVYYHDPVGTVAPDDVHTDLSRLLQGESTARGTREVEREGEPARLRLAPLRKDGRVIAVITVESSGSEPASELADDRMDHLGHRLLAMMDAGTYPHTGAPIPPRRGAPRVVDGIVQLDAQGIVQWASPNALSAFHRFGVDGEMRQRSLAELSTSVISSRSPVDESLPLVLMGRAAWRSDIQARGGTLSLRAVPLMESGVRIGAILMVRDVSELRRRERELITKDATIREVHHRVKNNLQTVAAMLRMQSRRMKSDEAREALSEAMRRISTIALVHESLLQGSEETVFFDEVIDRCLRLAVDAASASVRSVGAPEIDGSEVEVRTVKTGKVGAVRAEEATPLALVVTELATNAVEHGLATTGGTLTVRSERTGSHLVIRIEDDGVGIGVSTPSGLGTSIAQTLVQGELDGTLTWENRREGGTTATVDVYLDPIGR